MTVATILTSSALSLRPGRDRAQNVGVTKNPQAKIGFFQFAQHDSSLGAAIAALDPSSASS